jgi:hypothetical protein
LTAERLITDRARVGSMTACLALAACLTVATCLLLGAGSASAAPSVSLHASFSPETLGRATTLRLTVRIRPTTELVPPPVIAGELRYPAGLNFQLSGLGIDACQISTLELLGLAGCPPNSLMGYGSAIGAIPIKHETFQESADVGIVRTSEHGGHPALLLYVYVQSGVEVHLVLPVELYGASKPYGGRLDIQVPLVQAFREGPDISVTELHLVVGPKNLTYSERAHEKTVRYKPAGVPLPDRCPRGGFRFAVDLAFLGGFKTSATTAVPCPARR